MRVLRWAVAIGLMGVLSSCTVPVGGVLGVSVDDDGSPIVVVAVCDGRIDGG